MVPSPVAVGCWLAADGFARSGVHPPAFTNAHTSSATPIASRNGEPHVSSMIAATPLVQEPRPTLVGERVNSQGSRRVKELLLAEDFDGLVQVAEDQVEGGAHLLDVCVALTERQDEPEQMREVVKRISLSQPAPIQIDSTEPEGTIVSGPTGGTVPASSARSGAGADLARAAGAFATVTAPPARSSGSADAT